MLTCKNETVLFYPSSGVTEIYHDKNLIDFEIVLGD